MQENDIEDVINMPMMTTSKALCRLVFQRLHAEFGDAHLIDYNTPTEYFEASVALSKGIHDIQLQN